MRTTALFLALAMAAFGCNGSSSETADDAAQDTIDTAGKADGVVRPVGTFRNDSAVAGDFSLVVLKTDKTFHRETMVYCVAAPCPAVSQDGTYAWSKSGSTRYIRFLDENGDLIDRYAYKFGADVLKLRAAGTSEYASYQLAFEGWCGVPEDCQIQDLPQPRCPGTWTCTGENTCSYACGWPCEVAGGQCVGLAPGNCEDGEIGDANLYSCGGMTGVMCCLPKQPEPSCAPVCDAIGSRSEGWYNPCTGELVCWANCADHTAECGAIGSRSEGWYTTEDKGCNGTNLIGWAQCSE